MLLRRGRTFTTQNDELSNLLPKAMKKISWFRPPEYTTTPDTNGKYEGTYTVVDDLVLLNLGSKIIRQMILKCTELTFKDINPDIQYANRVANLHVHEYILNSKAFDHVDGTIISELHTDYDLLDDLVGREEIVLFMDRVRDKISLTRIDSFAVIEKVRVILE